MYRIQAYYMEPILPYSIVLAVTPVLAMFMLALHGTIASGQSVFGPGLKYTELGTDRAGNPTTFTFLPARHELSSIEAKLHSYSDTNKKSFVNLEQDAVIVDKARIRIRTRRDADTGKNSHFLRNRERIETEPETVDITPADPGSDEKDYMLLPPEEALSHRTGPQIDLKAWVNIEPELALVLDYQLSQDIGGDWAQKLEYAAITVNGVNGFFDLTNDSIRIKCELVHVIEIKSEAQQPFITNAGKRVDLDDEGGQGRKRWYMAYNPIQLIKGYQKWVVENSELLGHYDIAPLLAGVAFEGRVRGIATTPGACAFNVSGKNYANSAVWDKGANFEGIAVLAHEIGHSLGALHDGEPASQDGSVKIASTEECPFGDGFLMGYSKNNYTNAFRLSECSLRAIKAFVSTEAAACLRPDHKIVTGSQNRHESSRDAGNGDYNWFDPEYVCRAQAALNFQGVVSYQTPDEQCRQVKCELISANTSLTLKTSVVPPRNTPCGDGTHKGRCRNGFCVGQGPAVDMDAVCKIATRFEGSRFYSGSNGEALDKICTGDVWSCTRTSESTGNDNKTRVRKFKGVVPVVGTPCGGSEDAGAMRICFNKECVDKDKISDLNLACILGTGKQEAVQIPFVHLDPKCAHLIKCAYGTEFEFIGEASLDPDCNPALAIPVGRIRKEARRRRLPYQTDGSQTLQEVCEQVTGEVGSKIAMKTPINRNELCSKLVCIKLSGELVALSGNTPNGTICGPLRRCKAGECVPCGGGRGGG